MIHLTKLHVIYKIFLGPENMKDSFGKLMHVLSWIQVSIVFLHT